ncbi:STAS domain-containing protein [Tenggerimyces flavus]|uniref:Anti-sigma factor antagonist n=1 Tax=Tenggerimyces flavus TaxID=1708749 RepID=A0ABV7YPG3_9ACTN|nr:STAS domain-containing protein [Tenggerimyces flavus]MBM7786554.1 anti-anti-sigma factor [Tenggerimyces flavus]
MEQSVVSVDRIGSAVVVTPHGEIDAATTPALRDVLLAVLADRPTALVIDLSRVSFLDSVCLGALVGAAGRAALADCTFALANPTPIAARLLAITALDRALTVAPTITEALAGPASTR